MDKNKAVDDFMDGLDKSPSDPLENVTEDPLAIKEKEIVEDKGEREDKPLPFNKDPKVQRFIEKEIAKRLPKETETERFVKETTKDKEQQDEILSALTEIVGNDTPQKVAAVNRLRKAMASDKDEAVKKAVTELQSIQEREQQAATQEEKEAEDELEQGFDNIEEQFGVDLTGNTKLRNEFIDFIIKVAPKDSNGEVKDYPDFSETFKLFKDTRKDPVASRAKELSSRSMSRSSDASSVTKQTGDSWRDVDKIFSKIEK